MNRSYSLNQCVLNISNFGSFNVGTQIMCVGSNIGHFGHGHFGLGRFSPDISDTDVSATENAKGGRFGQNHKYKVGVCACINV